MALTPIMNADRSILQDNFKIGSHLCNRMVCDCLPVGLIPLSLGFMRWLMDPSRGIVSFQAVIIPGNN